MDVAISIIICTYNGIDRLSHTLDAILKLKGEISRELILVDNASTEDIEGFCVSYFSKSNSIIDFKFCREETPGLIHARIKGISEASYEHVLFCDDDNWLFPDYLITAADLLSKNPGIGALGGKGIAVFEGDKPDWFDHYSSSFGVGTQYWHLGDTKKKLGYLYGAGIIFKKSVLLEIIISKFQTVLTGRKENELISGDDVELCYLVQLKGYKLHYHNHLQFYHWMPTSRLSWQYYLNLKQGISRGSAFLFTYEYFYKFRNSSVVAFGLTLAKQLITNVLIYQKNLWFISKENKNKDLNLIILKSKKDSFIHFFSLSISHFKQLKEYF